MNSNGRRSFVQVSGPGSDGLYQKTGYESRLFNRDAFLRGKPGYLVLDKSIKTRGGSVKYYAANSIGNGIDDEDFSGRGHGPVMGIVSNPAPKAKFGAIIKVPLMKSEERKFRPWNEDDTPLFLRKKPDPSKLIIPDKPKHTGGGSLYNVGGGAGNVEDVSNKMVSIAAPHVLRGLSEVIRQEVEDGINKMQGEGIGDVFGALGSAALQMFDKAVLSLPGLLTKGVGKAVEMLPKLLDKGASAVGKQVGKIVQLKEPQATQLMTDFSNKYIRDNLPLINKDLLKKAVLNKSLQGKGFDDIFRSVGDAVQKALPTVVEAGIKHGVEYGIKALLSGGEGLSGGSLYDGGSLYGGSLSDSEEGTGLWDSDDADLWGKIRGGGYDGGSLY